MATEPFSVFVFSSTAGSRKRVGAAGEAEAMDLASKKAVQVKARRPAVQIRATVMRVADLLGDFSEQTGALFG